MTKPERLVDDGVTSAILTAYRNNADHAESIGFTEKPAEEFTPYCHLERCHRCKQRKMCVQGFRTAGNGAPTHPFYECEDCSREIKRTFELAELERAVISAAIDWLNDPTIGLENPSSEPLADAVAALLKAREK